MIMRLAWRSIWRSRRRTIITVGSICMGLAFTLFFIAIGEGVYEQMIDQVVRMQAGYVTLENPAYRNAPAVDLWITAPEAFRKRMESWPEVEKTKMLVLGQGIVKSGAGNVAAAIMAVEPAVERETSPLARNMIRGEYLKEGEKSVVVGSEMAERLNLDVGKKLVIATNDVNGVLVEQLFRVKGIFRTGSEEMDAYVLQMSISSGRGLFHMPEGSATQLGVILRDPGAQQSIIGKVQNEVDARKTAVLPWQEVLPQISSYIKMDKGSNIVFQGILIFLILFTIFNTLLMSVLERQREFAMLLALGTHPAKLRLQVFMESVFLAIIGCSAGLFLGGAGVYLAHVHGIDMSAFMGESVNISGFAVSTNMHAKMSPSILFGTTAIVFAATALLSLIPMRHATRLSVVETLR